MKFFELTLLNDYPILVNAESVQSVTADPAILSGWGEGAQCALGLSNGQTLVVKDTYETVKSHLDVKTH